MVGSTLPHSPWYEKTTDIERSHLVTALSLRSGHVPKNSYGYMMKKVDSPNCCVCNVVEDVFHIIMECTRTNDLRKTLNINRYDVGACNGILSNPNSEQARLLVKIISNIIKMI
jgi:hypothetical protein